MYMIFVLDTSVAGVPTVGVRPARAEMNNDAVDLVVIPKIQTANKQLTLIFY